MTDSRKPRQEFSKPRLLTPREIEDLRADARATSEECKRLIAARKN